MRRRDDRHPHLHPSKNVLAGRGIPIAAAGSMDTWAVESTDGMYPLFPQNKHWVTPNGYKETILSVTPYMCRFNLDYTNP